jgi:hypothetical protein
MEKNGTTTRTVDFTAVRVEVEIDKFEERDISQPLGNYIHQFTDDIGIDDIAHEIYRNGKAEMDEGQAQEIAELVRKSNLAPFIRLALVRHIKETK